ncbi:SpoIIE family protein phosphatase [Streptomyces sp. NPDC021140]|uniref:SpoIIE family protein phosphatase n=1 Tax=Streptomyces sp. NPDC021140 TaxID=3365116 RepID=UPI003790E195
MAIEIARLYQQVRNSSEQFQRLLLPRLPDLRPFSAGAAYRPAGAPAAVGGDWYDAMLRALYYDQSAPPSSSLTRLDRIINTALDQTPIATALLARLEPADCAWQLRWSSAGHPPPLLLLPDGGSATWTANRGSLSGWHPTCPAPARRPSRRGLRPW